MIYYNDFADYRGTQYTIELDTLNGVERQEMLTTDAPVEVKWQSDDGNIYSPIRKSVASIHVLGNTATDMKEELYTGLRKGVEVKLIRKSDSVTMWHGWVDPCNYNSEYTGEHDELEVNASDGLGCMKDIPYRSAPRGVKTLKDVLLSCFRAVGIGNNVYYHNSLAIEGIHSGCVLDNLYISESCFFDEKNDEKRTDDDVAWKLSDVVENVCLWLNMIIVQWCDDYYIMDIDALKAGNSSFTKIAISNGAETSVQLESVTEITAESYGGSDNSISKEGLFNKVNIRDNFHTFSSIIPSVYGKLVNITKASDETLQNSTDIRDGALAEVVASHDGETGAEQGNMISFVDRPWDSEHNSPANCVNFVAVKYFRNPYYKLYKYDAQGNDITNSVNKLNYTDTRSMIGATIAKFDVSKISDSSWFFGFVDYVNSDKTLDWYMAQADKSTLDFQEYVFFHNPESGHIENENAKPFMESVPAELTAFFGGDNAYLVIRGTYIYHSYMDYDPYPIPPDETDISEGRYAMDDGDSYLLAKLEWGGKYWNGSQWQTTACTFNIPYMKDNLGSGDRRADATMFKDLTIVNSVTWRMGLDTKGYCIPIPRDVVVAGMPHIVLYSPHDPNYHSAKSGDNEGRHYKHNCVFLKDFDIQAAIGDPTFSNRNETDTVYTNDTSRDANVNDFDDVEFKVCTYDGKSPNYSSVVYKGADNQYHFVGETTTGNHTSVQEAHMLRRIVTQYKKPATRLKLALSGFFEPWGLFEEGLTDKTYFLDCMSWKVAENVTNVELREVITEN